jgi:uncharacterized BrkB/YihY/UPF0761 family membrane protein
MASGARMGWITGVFSFAIMVALMTAGLVLLYQAGPAARKQLPQGDPNVDQFLKMLNDPGGSAVFAILGALIMSFFLLTTLTMLGGALAAKLSDKRA